jgi:2-polyprenyl-3-methyl-5-hydroxy-6-metoxy-1,4-benzoquinol methylase
VPVKVKYSKPTNFYLGTKKEFFSNNDALLAKAHKINKLYSQQDVRPECKICLSILPAKVDFKSHGIGYKFCGACGHLNGVHDDTKAFVDQVYISDDGDDYSTLYIDDSFAKRTEDIYIPKLDFLSESIDIENYSILDVGCGSGYFVCAALRRDIQARGVDVNASMVNFGNRQISHQLNQSPLSFINEDCFFEEIVNSNDDVISAIGVIEHLREPHKFFEAFQESSAQYIFYSVPMFSSSVFFEVLQQEAFPRQLSGGHTHLFVEESIKKMNSIIGISSIAEWRFGTDIMDLYRMMRTGINQIDVSEKFVQLFDEEFSKNIDSLQSVFDESHFCSEIHLVGKKLNK